MLVYIAGSTCGETAVSYYETIDMNDDLQAQEEESDPYYSQVTTAMESYSNAECDMNPNVSYDIVQQSNAFVAKSNAMAAAMMADSVYDDVQSLDIKGKSLRQ